MAKVFLGGTANGSQWRERLIPFLQMEFFNPVVPEWNEDAFRREIREREEADYCLYVITPKMEGVYSIAEVVDDSNKRSRKTILCVLEEDEEAAFTPHQLRSLKRTGEMVVKNGGYYCESLDDVRAYLIRREEEARLAEEAEKEQE
jgi:hypothetical protein